MFDAIVVAGGSARRLGGVDKPALDVAGSSLLERVLSAVHGATATIVVGPQRDLGAGGDVIWTREHPPGGGPVAAIAAALPHVHSATVIVLAADLPGIAPAVAPLLAALPGNDVAALTTRGRDNPLAAAWSTAALRAAITRLPTTDGAAARALLTGVRSTRVPDDDGWGLDCDTWDDLAAARDRLG